MKRPISLTKEQSARYREQLSIPGMTIAGQLKLLGSSVLVLSSQGQGQFVVENLAKFGIGCLFLIDKPDCQKFRIQCPSEDVQIKILQDKLSNSALEDLISVCEVVIDCVENWQEKLSLSDTCMAMNKPLIHSGVTGFRYQVYSMLPSKSACLRCALPLAGIDDIPLTPPPIGHIQAILNMVGSWQAIEAVKIIAKIGATQGNELIKFDCLSGEFEVVRGLDPQSDCPDCGRYRP